MEENGRRLYTADKQAVLFFGDKEGRRIYQVFLGLEDSFRFPKQPMQSLMMGKKPDREASFVFAIVDIKSQEVLNVVRTDIYSKDSEGVQKIVMRGVTGRQAQYLLSKDGALQKIEEEEDIISIRQQYKMQLAQPDGLVCTIECGTISIIICVIVTLLTGPGGLVCSIGAVVICALICKDR